MKANEFIKKFGLEYAAKVVKNQPESGGQMFRPYDNRYSTKFSGKKVVSVFFLRQLLESHELINSPGGVEQAKFYAIDANACGAFNDEKRIKQAILDVESCQ